MTHLQRLLKALHFGVPRDHTAASREEIERVKERLDTIEDDVEVLRSEVRVIERRNLEPTTDVRNHSYDQ